MNEKWELTKKGTIKTISVANARMALERQGVSCVPTVDDHHICIAYDSGTGGMIELCAKTKRNTHITYDFIRYLRTVIFDEFGFLPSYAAVEDAMILMASERVKHAG